MLHDAPIVLIQRRGTKDHYICLAKLYHGLSGNEFDLIDQTHPSMFPFTPRLRHFLIGLALTPEEIGSVPMDEKSFHQRHTPRPRNQFILYRQWMSAKLHEENPGLTAACICKYSRTRYLGLNIANPQKPRLFPTCGAPRKPRQRSISSCLQMRRIAATGRDS